jgi:rod shape-determining protein MreC
MINWPRQNGNKKSRVILLSLLFLSFLVVLNVTGLGNGIKNAALLVSSPLQKLFWEKGGKIDNLFETLIEINSLKTRNEELEKENQGLKSQILQSKELKAENEKLRTALDLGLEKDFQLLMAQVIAKDPLEDAILINQGSSRGLKSDMPVITPEKILVGKVGQVYQDFSQVLLISNKKTSLSAKISTETPGALEIAGLVKGDGNMRIVFDLVPQDKQIETGQTIVTSRLGGNLPPDLIIGQINRVYSSDIKPFQSAEIKSGFEIGRLDYLFVIVDSSLQLK